MSQQRQRRIQGWIQGSLKFTMIMALALLLGACGFGEGGGDDAYAQQARDFQKLAESYRLVQGVYQGSLLTSNTEFPRAPGTLIVYVIETDGGSNPDGSRRTPPVLKARFRLDRAVNDTDNLIMTGSFDRATGTLILTSDASSGVGGGSPGVAPGGPSSSPGVQVSMRGTVAGERFQDVDVIRRGGRWGVFQGVRVSPEATSPIAGDAVTERNRLISIFGPAEGRYRGVIAGAQPIGADIKLLVNFSNDPNLPAYLTGRMEFAGGDGSTGVVYLVAVQFDALTGQIFLQQSPDPGGRYSLVGWLRNGRMRVTVRDRNGIVGEYDGTRVSR